MIESLPPTKVEVIDDILSLLKSEQTFCLSGHQNPDADVVGSQLAILSLIRRLGPNKQVDIQNAGLPPRSLSYLSGFEKIQSVEKVSKDYDVLIVFECSGPDRMGNIIDIKTQCKKVINLDHHLHNPYFGHVNFVEPHTSSTAELVFKIFERSGLELMKHEAICLFTGLVADTGWFRYGNTNTQSHRIAERLLAAGVPVADLAEKLYMSRTAPAMKLLGWVLSHMKFYFENRVAVLTIPEQVFQDFNAGPDDIEEIVNYGLKVESVVASVLLKERRDQNAVKISLRSKNDWDINQVARVFGGGGHKNASGCTFTGNLQEAEKKIISEIQSIF